MGLRINLNIASLITQARLRHTSRQLDKVYEQLASGERINRAGDDAAGLAISQLLRSQVRSLDQAVRNANDGLSVIDTAEASLASVGSNVQRIRELAVQGANDSNTVENRIAIQSEIAQLLDEIDRAAGTVQFNGKNLLDGTFVNQRVQVGIRSTAFLPISISDMRVAMLGQQAIVTGANPVSLVAIAGGGDLIINGVQVGASTDDGISFINSDASAIAKAEAINRIAARTGVTAEVAPAVHQAAGASISAVNLDGTASAIFINGVNIGPVTVSAGDVTGSLRDAINSVSGATGVEASLAAGGELVLTARDGRNFQITTLGSVADELGLALADGDLTAQAVTGHVTLSSAEAITVTGSDLGLIGFTPAQAGTVPDPLTAIGQISVTTQLGAEDAIATADAALAQINRTRANLGAISNRLEGTMLTLQAQAENLRRSDSRIRDTDFAKATAEATQQQILQQAAVSILAQANMLPQMALRLLER